MAERPRILVIDDDEDVQILLKTGLGGLGFKVETADSGMMGLASLLQFLPDMILLDMEMPDMDGLTFLKRRNEFNALKAIPVIIVSAKGMNSDVAASLDAGANYYITKPFELHHLNLAITRFLARRRPSTPNETTQVYW
ncbi:response regulator [Asticcacaulis machinosus]|uniref:Response regulator n=1 Tax=Asticcacaulis machinosus TaxID=2984211 RepID=A0ABT5HN10_9CAUL|nr:response regulator [Asticcacaulis machinosus]MDC7677515.1 response regulator [Asticcacaulis machinosus]